MDWNQLGEAALTIIVPVAIAFLMWVIAQVAAILKVKWGVDIDVARLQEELNLALTEDKHRETIHSAAETAAAAIIAQKSEEILRVASQAGNDAGVVGRVVEQLVRTPGVLPGITDYIVNRGASDAIAALSPLPDAIDKIAVRHLTNQVTKFFAR